MDPFTQGLVGAATSEAIAGKRLPHLAWVIGFFAGMAADLDFVIRSANNPALFWQYHRQFTHALIFIPIGGAIIALFFLWIFKRLRPYKKTVSLISIVAYASHGLLDCCTSYGTVWFWPFSYERVEWNIISILDPIFSLILLLGLIAAVQKCKPKVAIITLCCAAAYLGFGIVQHYRASQLQKELARSRNERITRATVDPSVGQLFRWRSVMQIGGQLQMDDLSLWPGSQKVITGFHRPSMTQRNLPLAVKTNSIWRRDFQVFAWFANNYVAKAKNTPLTFADMRFVLRLHPPVCLWGLAFPRGKHQHGVWARRVRLSK